MSKSKKFNLSPDWKAAQRVQQGIASAIVKATLRQTPHIEVLDAAPLVEVVLHQGTESPASFWTDDPQAAERLRKLIDDLRRLAMACRFEQGIEQGASSGFGAAGNAVKTAANAERDALVRRIAAENRAINPRNYQLPTHSRLVDVEGVKIEFEAMRKIIRKKT